MQEEWLPTEEQLRSQQYNCAFLLLPLAVRDCSYLWLCVLAPTSVCVSLRLALYVRASSLSVPTPSTLSACLLLILLCVPTPSSFFACLPPYLSVHAYS